MKVDLFCPHGFELSKKDVYGIVAHVHVSENSKEDGKLCQLMNTLDTTPDAVAKAMFARFGVTTEPESVALITTPDVRKLVYEQLSRARGEGLVELLKNYLEAIECVRVVEKTNLQRELVQKFGETVIRNAKMVGGVNLDNLLSKTQMGAPQYPMERLQANGVKSILGTVENRISQHKENINDILINLPGKKK